MSKIRYDFLSTREDNTNRDDYKILAGIAGQTWHGPPSPSYEPRVESVDDYELEDLNLGNYFAPVVPVKPTRRRRGGVYANLSNYNTIP